jgi:molecular chaperone GrpE
MSRKARPAPAYEVAQLTADLQRLQAEFMNFRRRSEESRAEILDLARQDVVLHLLPLLDNIDRALAHRPDELKNHPWASGVEQIAKQAAESLKELGVERIKSVGQPFDPHLHEAISLEGGGGPHEVVTAELQPGYKLGDKVIRHAMVKVGYSEHPPPSPEPMQTKTKPKED